MNIKTVLFIHSKKYLTGNGIPKIKIHKILIPHNNSYIELKDFIENFKGHTLSYKLLPILNKIYEYTKRKNNEGYGSIHPGYMNEVSEVIGKNMGTKVFHVEI